MDISTKAGGLELANPLVISSGPMSGNDERILELAKYGLGGIICKTISPEAAKVERPCIMCEGNKLFNTELWSEYSAEDWLNIYLPNVRKASDIPLIASVGYDGDDFAKMIPIIEKNNLADGFEFPPRYTHDNNLLGRQVADLRKYTDKPIWVKLGAYVGDILGAVQACIDNGATGIATASSQGPQMIIDIKNRRPIGSGAGFSYASGASIKGTILAYVNMIKEAFPDLSVIASGGCTTATDVIEYLLAGADAVELLTVGMMNGRQAYAKIIKDLPAALEKYGFKSVEDVKATGLTKYEPRLTPQYPVIDLDKCTGCGRCANCCSYMGMKMKDGKPYVDTKECFGCGQCQTRCPVGAISGVF